MSKSLNLKVVGARTMHCAGCSRAVEFTLKMLPGVGLVEADSKSQEIRIEHSSNESSVENIISSLAMIGYETSII